ncbi:hypothetical protein E3Q17_04179 [Wallemia mellicola]|uniref:Uncharacterized protein n=1 Tax=Wallemia mellicola TaxID=1708541 RepID=A0A4T0NFL7_9BASI|nr:hypothetical protein E3Q17_04179 [Wallemia mellicola]TIC07454.1 hypothetical protein E3Q14_04256 [Wallemia mellicola]TIC60712.1 hypothetical protein E3Q02_04177 [Wallemia mellicola]
MESRDRVASEACPPCRTCEYRRLDRYNECLSNVFLSLSPLYVGTMSRSRLAVKEALPLND